MQGAIGILHFQGELFGAHQKLQIDQIAGTYTIDAQQPVTGLNAELIANGIGLHRIHKGRLR